LALPIATYPGLALTGAKVSDVVTNAKAQRDAQAALRERFHSPFALSAMDLSAEAEAFGCSVALSDSEIPTVTGRLVTTLEDARRLALPQPGDKRTAVFLEAARLLAALPARPLVFGGCIGPFSLAARLVGVSEAMELTALEPDLMHILLEKTTSFLAAYLKAFRASGACGVIMAEPVAGLLSPRAMIAFSSAYIKRIAAEVNDPAFTIVLHNCAAKLLHLPAVQETGLRALHFGAPMDIARALHQCPPDIVLGGNLDPTAIFAHSSPSETATRTGELLACTAAHRNFFVSSGCDVPPNAPLSNLDAFYEEVRTFNGSAVPNANGLDRAAGATHGCRFPS
jgi:uroporphyrinogen decarboxylase